MIHPGAMRGGAGRVLGAQVVLSAISARYWRVTSISCPANLLELTELRFFTGASDVTATGTVSTSTVPAVALANLVDNNLTTRSQWNPLPATDTTFWIAMDFGVGGKVINGIAQGGNDGSGASLRYMSGFTLQYSPDNSVWTTLASKSGLTFPGINTLSAVYQF